MNLREVQRHFRGWLVSESEAAMAQLGQAAGPGLRVHLNTYRSQLLQCLAETFGVVRAWLGETAFESAAAIHIDRVPPSSWTLDAYARDFPETLGLLYPADAEVVELARLERALAEIFVAADCAPVNPAADPASWEQIDWERAALQLVPSVTLLPVTTNAAAIWSALSSQQTPPAAAPLTEPAQLLLWRSEYMPRFRTLDPAEATALGAIAAGATFGALCAAQVDRLGPADGTQVAGAWLGQWLRDGLIARVT